MAVYLEFEQKIKSIQDEIEMAVIRGDNAAKEILEVELEKWQYE